MTDGGKFMNEEIKRKIVELKNKQIKEKFKELESIKILTIKDKEEVDEKIIGAFDDIRKIEYPKLFSIKEGEKAYKYVEYLYEKKNLMDETLRWLIPSFGGGSKWYEILVYDLPNFFDIYFDNGLFDGFSFADIENGMVIDIENVENDIDFYEKKFK